MLLMCVVRKDLLMPMIRIDVLKMRKMMTYLFMLITRVNMLLHRRSTSLLTHLVGVNLMHLR